MAFLLITSSPGANQSINLPADWNPASNTVECIGAGARGAHGSGTTAGGGGGGGGAYTKVVNISLAANTAVTVRVGAASGTDGGAGGDTWFNDTVFPTTGTNKAGAKGGAALGSATATAGGVGGAASAGYPTSGTGLIRNDGGTGGLGVLNTTPGGGGGAGGSTGAGVVGNAGNAGSNPRQGGAGSAGAGGAGGVGTNSASPGAAGGAGTNLSGGVGAGGGGGGSSASPSTGGAGGLYGGGGAGGGRNNGAGGAGAQGLIILFWNPVTIGNLTVTEAVDTILAGGSVPYVGNLTQTEAADTISSTGTVATPGGAPVNVAASANGGTAAASSTVNASFPASNCISGSRDSTKNGGWGNGGGWNDGTQNIWPDTFDVTFNATYQINEIDVITLKDQYTVPGVPTLTDTFNSYGIIDFLVQYWDGSSFQTIATVTANNNVWRQFLFTPISTNQIRITINMGGQGYSRLVEIEAWTAGDVGTDITGTLTRTEAPDTIIADATNFGPVADIYLVTSYTPPYDRNDYDGGVGMVFRPDHSQTYNKIGLQKHAGNTGNHTAYLYDYDSAVPKTLLRSATIDLTAGTVGNFYYADIAPFTVSPTTQYAIMTDVVNLGQVWGEHGPTVLTNGAYAVYAACDVARTSWGVNGSGEQFAGVDLAYVAPPTGTTGNLTQTEAADTIIAGGKVDISGALTRTEAADTIIAGAKVDVVGTLTQTEAPDTIIASGGPLVYGNLTQTEILDTISAGAKVDVGGALTRTEAPDTIVAGAKVDVGGVLTQTEAPDTIISAGKVDVVGALTRTEAPDTISSGGTVTGGAAPWTPADLGTDLWVWLDASDVATITVTGSGVSQWLDKSSYGRHVFQENDGNRPAYVTGKVQLYDQKGLHPNPPPFYPGSGYDYILVGKALGTGTYHTLLLTGSSQNISFLVEPSNMVGVWSNSFFQINGLTWTPGTDALFYGSVSPSSTAAMSKNGGPLASSVTTFYDSTLSSLGTVSYPQGFGDLYELIFVPFTSSADTRQKLEGYVAWKWSLAGLLPSDHPYKAAPPTAGPTGTTGTLNVTEAPDTIISAGSVPYVGALTQTEAPDTIVSGGKVDVGGVLSATEAPDTISAGGTVTGGALPPYFNAAKTGPSITLQNNNLTAIRLASSGTYDNTYTTTTSGASKVYVEIRADTLIDVGRNALGLGLDTGPILASWIGDTASAFGWYGDGTVYNAAALVSAAPTYAAGHWLGIALDRLGQTVQFKNITTASAWSAAINVASFGVGDVAVRATLQSQNQSYTVNFKGTFLGAPPASGYARWDGTAIDASAAVAQARVVVMA
jgi:hypothetical protein